MAGSPTARRCASTGGVGLAAIALGRALGATVIAVDIDDAALALAREVGADVAIDASGTDDVAAAVHALGGADVSVDCLGGETVATSSIRSLRPLGRHVQIGLFPRATATLPIALVVRDELELLGVHGQSASRFGPVFELIEAGRFDPERFVVRRAALDDVPVELPAMVGPGRPGVAVVTRLA